MPADIAWSVSLPHATFALVCRPGPAVIETAEAVVVRAAPIARWAVGRPARDVLDYYRRRGATVERLD